MRSQHGELEQKPRAKQDEQGALVQNKGSVGEKAGGGTLFRQLLFLDEKQHHQGSDAQQSPGQVKNHAKPDQFGKGSTDKGPHDRSGHASRLEQPQGVTDALPGGIGGHQGNGRRNKPGNGPVEQA